MSDSRLLGSLLADVSRTFYLSIRVLPTAVRAPIGVAYLLARASDTIADSALTDAPTRLHSLDRFLAMIQRGKRTGLEELRRDIHPPDPAEQRLIARLGECLDASDGLSTVEREEVRTVLGLIIRGQKLDVERFPEPATGGAVRALRNAGELEEYTYLVAGCVGEFWTRICAAVLPGYAHLPEEQMRELSRDFGQGLQLVNILRDLPADLRAGRCYLPAEELAALGGEPCAILDDPSAAVTVSRRWQQTARAWLRSGLTYTRAVRRARLRFACFLPAALGLKTLDLLDHTPALLAPERVKVSRKVVRETMWAGLTAAFSDAPLQRL